MRHIFLLLATATASATSLQGRMLADYFLRKDVKYAAYLTCRASHEYKAVTSILMSEGIRMAVGRVDQGTMSLERLLSQWDEAVGVVLDGACRSTQDVLIDASESMLFDAAHAWVVLSDERDARALLEELKLSVDADVVVASHCDTEYRFTDVFNFGRIQGNHLEVKLLGTWNMETGLHRTCQIFLRAPLWQIPMKVTVHREYLLGLEISLPGFKYYDRWDFHNLTLRAVSVIRGVPEVFDEKMLSEPVYTDGVAAMTKICSALLNLLKEMHNFRFNYTIVGRWIGTPQYNSTPTVSNTLFWREQDISSTSARLFPDWLDWVDPFFPSATKLETKFYYIIPDKGVGVYENRFLTPMSPGVWWCSAAAGVVCALVLVAAAATEGRPEPGSYGIFSVLAAGFQQDYEDGEQSLEDGPSQSRKLALLVVGLTSMLLYNYYTSSVVSWLLNAAAPTLNSLDGLIKSDFELIFEDIGYTRGWLANPGFFYYSGFKNEKEDELRVTKVTNAKRTVPLLLSVEEGIELVRTGRYAYHTEPYTASQAISRTFVDEELCALGGLPIITPAPVYIMGQKRSPYKQFFVWSMMRLLERGHVKATRARVGGNVPPCSGRIPRALSLGQSAPAFLLLAEAMMLAVVMLAAEMWWHRYKKRTANVKQRQPPLL